VLFILNPAVNDEKRDSSNGGACRIPCGEAGSSPVVKARALPTHNLKRNLGEVEFLELL